MKMKKVIAVLSVTSMLDLSLAGCGGNKDSADNKKIQLPMRRLGFFQ